MRPYHIFLTASQCPASVLADEGKLASFLEKLAYATRTQITSGPHTSERKKLFPGVTCTAITHTSHLAIHTFAKDGDIVLHILSYEEIRGDEVKDLFVKHFRHAQVRIKESVSSAEPTECEETGCTRPATRDWQGRRMCNDHYERYRDEHERVNSDDTVF